MEGGHYTLYHKLFGVNQQKMDRAGWLHISGGRVDIQCRLTPQQKRWLDANKPNPESAERNGDDWRMRPLEHDSDRREPIPYDEVDRYDVRPAAEDDWDRLMLRIVNAREGNRIPAEAL